MTVTVSVPDAQTEKFFKLVLKYASCSTDVRINMDATLTDVVCKTAEGHSVPGCIAAARYVAGLGSRADQLLGSDDIKRAKVCEASCASEIWERNWARGASWLPCVFRLGSRFTSAHQKGLMPAFDGMIVSEEQ